MRLLKNLTICLGVLALLTAAPACGDSGTRDTPAEGEGTEGEGTEGEGTEGEGTEGDAMADETMDDAGGEAGPEADAESSMTDDSSSEEEDDTASAGGACINDADLAIIDDPDVDVTAVATEYAYACLTDEDIGACAAAGVSTDTGLSSECAYCYAEQVVCAAENCLSQCISDSEAQACVDCRNENCVPLFEPCSGIAASTDDSE